MKRGYVDSSAKPGDYIYLFGDWCCQLQSTVKNNLLKIHNRRINDCECNKTKLGGAFESWMWFSVASAQ